MLDPEKPCVFFDAENNELLVSYPEKTLGLPELWEYIKRGLEDNIPELEAFARKHFATTKGFVDPIWQPAPGTWMCAIYEPDNADLYRDITLTPFFSRGAIHLTIANVTEKYFRTDWEKFN